MEVTAAGAAGLTFYDESGKPMQEISPNKR